MDVAQLNLSASSVPASHAVVSGLDTVGFGKRAAARIIDLVIHLGVGLITGLFVGIVVVVIASMAGTPVEPWLERMTKDTTASKILGFFGFILYSTLCEGLFGATAGKYLLGMVVLNEDHRPASYTQAVGRSFAFVVDSLFFGLVGYLSMKDSPTDQRYGDKWARTVVATRASAPPTSLRKPMRFLGAFLLAVMLDAIAVGVGVLM